MPTVEIFSGFPEKTVSFLCGLAAHNDREWFAAHKKEYETEVLEPAKAFVRAMGERLRRLSPQIKAEPRTDGSLFRLYRDTRFSPDKSPYKTNLGIFFWEGGGPRMDCPGYYFHLEPPNLMLGGGLYIIPRPLLERYRRAVADAEYGPGLAAIVKKLTARPGYTLGGEHYKRVPPGYDPAPGRSSCCATPASTPASRFPFPPRSIPPTWSTSASPASSPWSRCTAGSPPWSAASSICRQLVRAWGR